MPFVERVAAAVLERTIPLHQLTLVVPSERMITYLQRAFYTIDEKPKMSPRIITIDHWMQQQVDEPVIDRTRLLFHLYNIFKEDPADPENESFDAFMSWGQLLLNDFDEIERYMVDPKQLFRNLRDIRELENWSFNQEELSPGQQKFLAFWDKLGPYYYALSDKLSRERQTTKGKVYRAVANNIDLVFRKNKNMHFVFAGFNALSSAELDVMKQLYVMGRAQVYCDNDAFYLNDSLHEAGAFQRVLSEKLQIKQLPFVENRLRTKAVNMTIVECAQTTGQAKVVGTLLAQLSQEELNETLVLLGDEQLIVSLLQHLPASIGKANITLGLPLRSTSLRIWSDLLFRVQEHFQRRGGKSVYYKDAVQFFHHPFIQGILSQEEQAIVAGLERSIVNNNRLFLRPEELAISERLTTISSAVFTFWGNDWPTAMKAIHDLNSTLDGLLPEKHLLEKAALRSFDRALTGLTNLLHEPVPEMQLGTFRQVFNQHWYTESMSYFGNPTEGLQIMGLLETRGLDFKRIIAIGLNEGTMPPTNAIQTLIPMDLRRFFGLPTPREKQGLFAHHFYRLLHAAEEIHVTYATAQEGMGSQEPSRFIQQLELELAAVNPNFRIEKRFYTLGNQEEIGEHKVEKTPEVIRRLDDMLQEGLTFSKLKDFIECPLNFYYRYVMRIGEESKVEESIESNTLGTILHQVLENLLLPFARTNPEYIANGITPRPPVLDDWKNMKKIAPLEVDKAFQQHFSEDKTVYASGTNHISYVIANEIIQNILNREIALREASPQEALTIEALEHEIRVPTQFELNGEVRPAVIRGILDRIDAVNGKYRVIDYKSGEVNEKKVTVPPTKGGDTVETILKKVRSTSEKSHVLQLLIYSYLFRHAYKTAPAEVGIFSFINTSESPFSLHFSDDLTLSEATDLVESVIGEILKDLYDTSQPFAHRHGAQYCLYCGEG